MQLFENGCICDAAECAIAVICTTIDKGTAGGDERFSLVVWATPTRDIEVEVAGVEPGRVVFWGGVGPVIARECKFNDAFKASKALCEV